MLFILTKQKNKITIEFFADTENDEFGIKNPSEEYVNVFQNIPMLFEYLLETLEEKPEILEKNDVSIFKRSIPNEKDNNGSDDSNTDEDDATTLNNADAALINENTVYIGQRDVVFSLTSEEVAEQALEVERMLDEHNNSNK